MSEIKILIPSHVTPDIKSVITLFFENIVPTFRQHTNVHLIWLVYQPNRIKKLKQKSTDFTILDIHDYKNAVDVITTEKPDLIYCSPDWSFIDYSFSSAANKHNIPAFFMIHGKDSLATKKNTLKNVQSNFSRFLQDSTPTDFENDKKQFLKRGRFFLYKYFFLLRTKLELKQSILDTLFSIWKYVLTDTHHSKYASNVIQFLENEELLKSQLELGIKKSNLFITGNPMYDGIFKKLDERPISVKNDLIRILFAPSTLYEHGFWTLKQRNTTIVEICDKINQDPMLTLSVKIHPSTSILSEYVSLIHSINSKITIFQKGSIEDYLFDIDIIISSQSSTAEVYGLLANKRIVICNFFDSEDDLFVKQGIAVSCKQPSDIISSIQKALTLKSYEKNRQKFINDFLFKWDGNSSERIYNQLTKILQNYNNN